MKRKIFMKTAGGGGFPRLARVMTLLMLMLTGLGTGVKAADVLYATVDGTAMTLNYGAKPDGAYEYDGSNDWSVAFRNDVTTATVDESCKDYSGETLEYLFGYMKNLTAIAGLENLNTANITRMSHVFTYCKALTSLDLSTFNTASVTDMSAMFAGCSKLTSLDLSTWNTAKVKNMATMFYDCSSLTTIKVGDGWSTNAVTSSNYMFGSCSSLPNFDSSKTDKTNAHTGTGGYLTAAAPAAAEGFTAALAPGTEDAGNWKLTVGNGTAQSLPVEGLSEGQTLTLTYTGNRRVKSVKAVWTPAEGGSEEPAVTGNTVDLAALTANYEAQDGDVLTGTLAGNYKITIADGATVTLQGVTINGVNNNSYKWAGLTLAGDGTIILKGENSLKGFYEDWPGIHVPSGKTVTIQGNGSLTASSNGYGAGIGGGYQIACGNITIEGGTITATGGDDAAGIGGGHGAACGNILITDGTITATGGISAAGIGSGVGASCGTITITDGVTSVTATKGSSAPNSIGKGYEGSCGTVTIGGTEGAISTSPYTYQP